ncbi:hypothetical protein INN71_02705 [Nocardioides sp. ChNu-153]|uniref:hypothetical protein n=1 Tax=Nocardioides sp. ChNu-153 TaxID=2779364 RepID=UPI0026513770|nr:hypothetical protein [Nocardioides sp. ChNu-153]MDN7120296.1 hypothetical protein [Nocardioides sp. ChNu-153]
MKRLKLSPRDAAWLNHTIARNQATFGGFTMMADDGGADGGDGGGKGGEPGNDDGGKDGKSGSGGDPQDKDKTGGQDKGGDDTLGDGGKKALDAERTARKQLENQLSDLKKGLLSALGGDTDGKSDDGDVLKSVQQQLADIKHENTVLALATRHRITDTADLELLKSTRDQAALDKLAARLAPKDGDQDNGGGNSGGNGKPKPDRTQGGAGGDADDKPSVDRGRERARQRHPRRSKTS